MKTPLLTKEGWQPLRLTGWFFAKVVYAPTGSDQDRLNSKPSKRATA